MKRATDPTIARRCAHFPRGVHKQSVIHPLSQGCRYRDKNLGSPNFEPYAPANRSTRAFGQQCVRRARVRLAP